MNRLRAGTLLYQQFLTISQPACLINQPIRCPRLFDFRKLYQDLNIKCSDIVISARNLRLLQKQIMKHQMKISQKYVSNSDEKEDFVINNKILKKKILHEILEQNKEKMRETEKKIRAKGEFILKDIKETKDKMRERMEEVIERENVYTIPNLLCVTRIVASPFLGYLIVQSNYHFAFGLLITAGITDLLDGWIARTWKNQSSKLGSFLDPMADKVLIATLFLTLTYSDLIPVVLTGLIIARDFLLVVAGFVIRYMSLPSPRTLSRYFDVSHATAQLAPTFISKVNTFIQLILVGSTLAAPVFDFVDHPLLQCLWYVTGVTTVASALSYVFSKNTYKILKRTRQN